jgi:hypothetical protein
MLSVVMPSVVMLNVVMLNAIMLGVVAPYGTLGLIMTKIITIVWRKT